MSKWAKPALCCVAVVLGIQAQAQIPTVMGVANDRGSSPTVRPGLIGYVLGSNFGTLENTTIMVAGLSAKVLAVSSNRICALFPPNLPPGLAPLTVTVDGKVSKPINVTVTERSQRQVGFGHGSVSAGPPGPFSPPHSAPKTPASRPASPATTAGAGSGIVYTCDPTIYALSATACDTLNTTIAGLYSDAFTNANASIYVTTDSGGFGNSNWSFNWFSYSSFRSSLIAAATSANDTTAVAGLPVVNPYGSSSVGVLGTVQRALGLSATPCLAAAACYDGTISIGNSVPWYFRTGSISGDQYDFFTIVEHETDEILGTPSCARGCGYSGTVFAPDLFRYHSDGTRSFAAGTNDPCSSIDSTNACLSIDGINMLQQYNNLNNGEDAGDWVYNCARPLVQDYALCAGTAGVDISPLAEILVLDVIGYTLRTPLAVGGVTGVTSSTPNGTYGVGSSISVQIAFSEEVTVTGTSQLALNSGGTASYILGSGTSTLTFMYVVMAGQSSALLDYTSTGALTLNGGSINGPGGIPVGLTLPTPGMPGSFGGTSEIVINTLPTDITIGTNPSRLQVTVDGNAAEVAPLTLSLTQGSHTIAVATTQAGATCSGYGYSATATIHHQYVAADANNYTVTIAGTWPMLAMVVNGGQVTNPYGYDICFTNLGNTAILNWELESYDAATGAIVAHVLVGSISSTVDTTFSIYFGNPSVTTFQGGSAGAWDASTYPYQAIWHFGNGTVLNGSDSSPNGNSLTSYGATAASGEIGGGAAFASSAYMTASASSSLDFSGAVSFSFWENLTTLEGYPPVLVSRTNCNDGNWQIYDIVNDGLYFNFWSESVDVQAFTSTLLPTGVWSYVVLTYDGSDARFYVNGALTNAVSMSGTRNSDPNTLYVGTDSCGHYLQGSLDELRIAQGAWPSALIQTMYNNQSAPSAFVTLSGMTPVNPSSAPHPPEYVFTGWSDGGAASHPITVGTTPATYTASFRLIPTVCSFSLSASSAIMGEAAGTGSVAVAAPPGCAWSATSGTSWLSITAGTFGSGNGTVTYSAAADLGAQRTGRLTIASQTFTVTQTPPFGSFDVPTNGQTGIAGALPVGGWALSTSPVSVQIWRNPVPGETPSGNGLILLGNTTFVAGSRPDVAAAYPGYLNSTDAGWGALILTNGLPNGSGSGAIGNGTYTLHALATDSKGVETDLGAHAITVNNATSVLPFGTIDTPASGATVSGTDYVNFGWVLTPEPNIIPINGSTISVYIDNKPMGHPVYNNPRSDIQSAFPSYANTNGAVGYLRIDTTKLSNGLHQISWGVSDSAGNAAGIGSRFFTVQN